MRVHRLTVLVVCSILATGVVAVTRHGLFRSNYLAKLERTGASIQAQPAIRSAQSGTSASPSRSAVIPKHIVYGLLFKEVVAFNKKADELEREGNDASTLRQFHQTKVGLNAKQNDALLRIASDCVGVIDKLDRQAKEVIDKDRALHNGGKLSKGEIPPPPPEELTSLEDQRRGAILQAREQLRAEFGDAVFTHFDDFEQNELEARAKPLASAPHSRLVPSNGTTILARPQPTRSTPGEKK